MSIFLTTVVLSGLLTSKRVSCDDNDIKVDHNANERFQLVLGYQN